MVVSLSHDRAAAKLVQAQIRRPGRCRVGVRRLEGRRSQPHTCGVPAADALPLVTHWIDGKPTEGASARRGEVFDPATGRVTKRVAFASPDDVDAAVTAAAAAFAAWRASAPAGRTHGRFPVFAPRSLPSG